jgi:hypothetical protein
MRNLMMAGRGLIIAGLAAILLWVTPLAKAAVDSNYIDQGGVRYYIQTDKTVYDLGENVEMMYRVTNLGADDITFHFDDQVQYYFTVKENNNLIWSVPKVGFPGSSEFVLHPGNYKEYVEIWDMHDNQGVFVTSGIYDLRGSLHPILLSEQDKEKYVPVSVQIGIIPEPTSMLLFGAGLMGLLSRNRRKPKN